MKVRQRIGARQIALVVALAVIASASVLVGHRLGDSQVPATLAVGAGAHDPAAAHHDDHRAAPAHHRVHGGGRHDGAAAQDHGRTWPDGPRRRSGRLPILAGSIDGFRGLGQWVDVFDWSNEFTNNKPTVGVAAIDRMADLGVQTLYIQTARHDSPNEIVDPGLLHPLINRAHARGMAVIALVLAHARGHGQDLARLVASSALNVEGIGVDIESRKVEDAAERSRRLTELERGAPRPSARAGRSRRSSCRRSRPT